MTTDRDKHGRAPQEGGSFPTPHHEGGPGLGREGVGCMWSLRTRHREWPSGTQSFQEHPGPPSQSLEEQTAQRRNLGGPSGVRCRGIPSRSLTLSGPDLSHPGPWQQSALEVQPSTAESSRPGVAATIPFPERALGGERDGCGSSAVGGPDGGTEDTHPRKETRALSIFKYLKIVSALTAVNPKGSGENKQRLPRAILGFHEK